MRQLVNLETQPSLVQTNYYIIADDDHNMLYVAVCVPG